MSKLVIFNNGLRGVDISNASMTEEGVLKVKKIKTTGIPTEDNDKQYIGWNRTLKGGRISIPSDYGQHIRLFGPETLFSGVYYIKFQISIYPNGNDFQLNSYIKPPNTYDFLEYHPSRFYGYSVMPVIITHILTVQPNTTQDIEFTCRNFASFSVTPTHDCKAEIIRIA